jgi:hypothetical protein
MSGLVVEALVGTVAAAGGAAMDVVDVVVGVDGAEAGCCCCRVPVCLRLVPASVPQCITQPAWLFDGAQTCRVRGGN